MKPEVSIITPSYNSATFIGETIESVQKQTFSSWEMIIVDDCSEDNTVEIIKKYIKKDSRIKIITTYKNSGPAVARGKAINVAEGDFIAFLDSDDLWEKEKLEMQVGYMKKFDIAATCTSYKEVEYSSGKEIAVKIPLKVARYRDILYHNTIGNSTVILDRKKISNIKIPNIVKRNDYALWLKILKTVDRIVGLNIVLATYRVRSGSVSRKKIGLIKYHWKIYREFENMTIPKSIYTTCRIILNKLKDRINR